MNKKQTPYLILIVTSCFLAFECVSYSSSYEGLYMIFGRSDWARLLAWAFVAVDLGGIYELVNIRTNAQEYIKTEKENNTLSWAVWLFMAWLISAIGDTFLTYLPVSVQMHKSAVTNIMVINGAVGYDFYTTGIPFIMAVLIWGIQVAIISWASKLIDEYARSGNKPTSAPTPRRTTRRIAEEPK